MSNEPKTTRIEVKQSVRAAPEAIYDRWLDARSPGGPWFGVAKAIVNPVVDGLFYHCISHEGRDWAHYGRFVALERGRIIEQTWVSEATRGRETLLSLTFAPRGPENWVILRQFDLPDDEMGRRHEEGWMHLLAAMAKAFVG
jgi:hypothetical protein